MQKSIDDHFVAYLRSFRFWPSESQIREMATEQAFALHASPGWEEWGGDRRSVAMDQLVYKWTGIEVGPVDGLYGPQTAFASEAYAYWQEHGVLPDWRDAATEVQSTATATSLPSVFPKQSDMVAFYGAPGPEIQRQLTRVRCPWRLRIAWNLSQSTDYITIHNKCAESLEEVLAEQWDLYGDDVVKLGLDLYGGSYNHRKMRGGSSWSTHAFGAAIDWNPSANALRTKAPHATLSRSEFIDWWAIWERHGWLSLGRARDFDWMHVQAAKLG